MSVNVRINVHHAVIAARLRDPSGVPARFVRARSAMCEAFSKQACPVDQGRLRQSITHRVTEGPGQKVTGTIYSPLKYARWQHEGTGIYGPTGTPIFPKRGQFLVFEVKRPFGPLRAGQRRPARGRRPIVFARSVRGVPGSPFLVHGLELAMPGAIINRH